MLFQSVRLSAVAVIAAGAIGTVVLAQQGRGPVAVSQEAPEPAPNSASSKSSQRQVPGNSTRRTL